MSSTFRCPKANTIAFGGVATGNAKAKLAQIVTGTRIYKGWTPMVAAYKTATQND